MMIMRARKIKSAANFRRTINVRGPAFIGYSTLKKFGTVIVFFNKSRLQQEFVTYYSGLNEPFPSLFGSPEASGPLPYLHLIVGEGSLDFISSTIIKPGQRHLGKRYSAHREDLRDPDKARIRRRGWNFE